MLLSQRNDYDTDIVKRRETISLVADFQSFSLVSIALCLL